MSNTKWEQKREALAKEWADRWYHWPVSGKASDMPAFLDTLAGEVLAREAEREGPLVEALVNAVSVVRVGAHPDSESRRVFEILTAALKAHRALDAPPQRTLAEVAKDVVMTRATFRCAHTDGHATVSDALLDERAEALKREEGKR